MDNRTNFVKISNIGRITSGEHIYRMFELCGDLLDITAIGPDSLVLTYMRRSAAKECTDLISSKVYLAHLNLSAEYFYPTEEPDYSSNPILQGLGVNICNDSFRYDYRSFVPWNARSRSRWSATPAQSSSNSGSETGARRKVIIGGEFAQTLKDHTIPWKLPSSGEPVDECPICLHVLGDTNYNIYSDKTRSLMLRLCKHTFHQTCLEALLKQSTSRFLQCPICRNVHGTRTGTRPTNGTITHNILDSALPGHEQYKTIKITFNFVNGVQGADHPSPGQPFTAPGFPRMAYLPDSPEGIDAMHGIYVAWQQKLIFTVGRSITNSLDNVVTWDGIHMKTSPNGTEHGYPDAGYLRNLFEELEGFGITSATISSHKAKYPQLRNRGCL